MSKIAAVIFSLTCQVAIIHPFWRYAALYNPTEYSFLLDSGMDPERLGQHSFLGGHPLAVLRAWKTKDEPLPGNEPGSLFSLELKTRVSPSGNTQATSWAEIIPETSLGDPFLALRKLQQKYFSTAASKPQTKSPSLPFGGGLVGAFGYGLGHAIENISDTARNDLNQPDMIFMVAGEILAMDHRTGKAWLTVTGRGHTAAEAEERATQYQTHFLERLRHFENENLDEVIPTLDIDRLARSLPLRNNEANSPRQAFSIDLETHFNRATYTAAIQKCRDHIFCGDAFEVCLTHRLEAAHTGSPWALYQVLRHINPAPFAAWLQCGDFQVISASPERFLQLNADRLAESRPIKGTRARGLSPAEDADRAYDLATSEKDRAENIMIVDLVRNDLGKVCRTGSVKVPEMLVVEKYSTVFQLVSTVQGILEEGHDAFDLVRACFPGGSMTGAPKIEAMHIIDRLEPVTRGLYSGAIGYIDASGTMDLNIVIRTLVCQDGKVSFGVGGAIVADSDPDAEYTETLDKAQAMVDALTILRQL